MSVFIDAVGRFYQAGITKDPGDAKIEFPSDEMQKYLTGDPKTPAEFGKIIIDKKIEEINTPQVKDKEVEESITIH